MTTMEPVAADAAFAAHAIKQKLAHLADEGFDFNIHHTLDFTIAFDQFPAPPEAMAFIHRRFNHISVSQLPEGEISDDTVLSTVTVKIKGPVNTAFIQNTRKSIDELISPYEGWCHAWAIWD